VPDAYGDTRLPESVPVLRRTMNISCWTFFSYTPDGFSSSLEPAATVSPPLVILSRHRLRDAYSFRVTAMT